MICLLVAVRSFPEDATEATQEQEDNKGNCVLLLVGRYRCAHNGGYAKEGSKDDVGDAIDLFHSLVLCCEHFD